ncbi:MAG: hypothetical protein WCQ95_02710 [Bacteroidota bacterium]
MDDIIDDGTEFYIMQDGKQVKLEIPPEGMLGLIAYGDIGLRAWRKARQAEIDKKAEAEKLKVYNIKDKETDE